ncbi:hypothetical protein AAK894_08935 [Lachnospiraceae bacterium 46-61]
MHKNQIKTIQIMPLAQKEQEAFLHRCDKLYLSLLQKNTYTLEQITLKKMES